uniref:Protein kinase domain-containing protein n=1 Tax=Romanomermis culicivorax TaxID=13658 RepID=A0A915KMZ6_ROMCU
MPPSNRCRDETLISSDESDDDDRSRRNRKTFISKRYKEASIGATRFEGAYARVVTCVSLITGKDFAVKIIEKRPGHSRVRIIKEIELFHLCVGHPNIVQLVEYFEENDKFYLIFEKMHGGSLLGRIQRKICFSEEEARGVVRDIANGLKFLHDNGVAHRDLKPENLLCSRHDSICPVKLCDLDLASKIFIRHQHSDSDSITTPELQSP